MLYLECTSGISGDMTVAALLDAGAREGVMRRALDSLPVDGFSVRVSHVKKSGLDACDFAVLLDGEHENHDHDMTYLHGSEAALENGGFSSGRGHTHSHGNDHFPAEASEDACGHERDSVCGDSRSAAYRSSHEHAHTGGGSHTHRGLPEILAIIDAADMTERARDIARRAFEVLADAEAKAHGIPRNEVHFHEVGAVDSIADVVAAAACFDDLDMDEVAVPLLCEGRGTVRCQHGVIPVPVPAVANIASAHGIPLRILDVQGELVTPTGAALVAAVRTRAQLPDRFVIERTGIGAGKRAYETPGILRAFVIRES